MIIISMLTQVQHQTDPFQTGSSTFSFIQALVYVIVYLMGFYQAFRAYREFKAISIGLPEASSNSTMTNMNMGGTRQDENADDSEFQPFTGKVVTQG